MGDNDHEIAVYRQRHFQQGIPILGGTYFKSNYLSGLFSPGASLGPAMYSSPFQSSLNQDYSPLNLEFKPKYFKPTYSANTTSLDYIAGKYK